MRSRARVTIAAVVVLATVATVAWAVYLSLDPGNYFFYKLTDRAKWVYNPAGVAIVGSLMLAEGALVLFALIGAWPRSLWLRCLVPLGILYGIYWFLPVVHMPAYAMLHFAWALLLLVVLAAVASASTLRQLYLRLKA